MCAKRISNLCNNVANSCVSHINFIQQAESQKNIAIFYRLPLCPFHNRVASTLFKNVCILGTQWRETICVGSKDQFYYPGRPYLPQLLARLGRTGRRTRLKFCQIPFRLFQTIVELANCKEPFHYWDWSNLVGHEYVNIFRDVVCRYFALYHIIKRHCSGNT